MKRYAREADRRRTEPSTVYLAKCPICGKKESRTMMNADGTPPTLNEWHAGLGWLPTKEGGHCCSKACLKKFPAYWKRTLSVFKRRFA